MLLKHFLPSNDICCLLFILKFPSWRADQGKLERIKEDCGGLRVGPGVSLPGWAVCGGDILTVMAPALVFSGCSKPINIYLETDKFTGITTIVLSARHLCWFAHMHFCCLEKLFSVKTNFYSFSLQGFRYQFLT